MSKDYKIMTTKDICHEMGVSKKTATNIRREILEHYNKKRLLYKYFYKYYSIE